MQVSSTLAEKFDSGAFNPYNNIQAEKKAEGGCIMKKRFLLACICCFACLFSMLPGLVPTADALATWGEVPAEVDKVLDDYIAENFYAGMPDEEKMDAIARFPAQYDYNADNNYSSYVKMIQSGCGNCWASTGAILELCQRLGLEAYARDADMGAGVQHANALVVAGEGDYYVLDAGYTGKAPRYYSVSRQTTLFSYSTYSKDEKLLTVTQYDGDLINAASLTVPETIDVYDYTGKLVTYTVACIGRDFIDPTTFVLPAYVRPRQVNIQEVVLPKSIQRIESSAFGNCGKLNKIVFTGSAPIISVDAFYGVTATVYYPGDADGWTAEARQNYGGTLTWVPYCSGGHTSTEGTVIEKATCQEDGRMSCICSICGASYTEVIPSSGKHSYSGKDFLFDESTGTHSQTCTICGVETTENCTFGAATVKKAASVYQLGVQEYRCTVCGGSCEAAYPYRIFGDNRYETGFAAADTLKEILGVDQFETIIVACGTDFADALAGSYLANQKNAPILLVNKHTMLDVKAYITKNLSANGMVYLLGGDAAISSDMEEALESFHVRRLAGANRYETNLKILAEAGTFGGEILICTGKGFADSLSASAVNRPILLVNRKLNNDQKEFLESSSGKFIIIGGESAVNAEIEAELGEYGTVERIGGANRYETSVLVAQRFFRDPKSAVLAYAQKFPDGLCGGPVAYNLKAPLILTATGKEAAASEYAEKAGVTNGVVLGGSGLISDETARKIFE